MVDSDAIVMILGRLCGELHAMTAAIHIVLLRSAVSKEVESAVWKLPCCGDLERLLEALWFQDLTSCRLTKSRRHGTDGLCFKISRFGKQKHPIRLGTEITTGFSAE